MTTPHFFLKPSEQSYSDDGECKKCLPVITELRIQRETKINEVNQLKHEILSYYGSGGVLEFFLTDDFADGHAKVVGEANTEALLDEAKPHGITTPSTGNFRVEDTAFHKFDWNDAAALGTCSHCFPSHIKSTQNELDCSRSQAGFDLLHHQQFRGGDSPVKRTTSHHLGLNQLFQPM